VIVLDTHALVWWSSDPARLSARARRAIEAEDALGVPAIVFWETSLLVRKRKLDLGMPTGEWADRILAIPRVAPLDLTPEIALEADDLTMHADPADRFIVATALRAGAPVATKDRLLRGLRFLKTVW
jgi:PIN domain nuclease of toxin-antitoxin system